MRAFHVRCPFCSTEFPVDPDKVPPGGVAAICSECDEVFQVTRPAAGPAEPALERPSVPPVADPVGPSVADPIVPFFAGPVEPQSPVSDPLGSGELQISLGSDAEPEEPLTPPFAEPVEPPIAEPVASAPAAAPLTAPPPPPEAPAPPAAPPKKTSIPMPKGQPPFVDLSSFANETMSGSEAGVGAPSAGAHGVAKERFGKRDPHERARHLSRVLVSDIIAYYPVRYQESLARGTLKEDFDNEVKKSWKEYVDQVGIEMAESTPYFNQALNEVLARGKSVF